MIVPESNAVMCSECNNSCTEDFVHSNHTASNGLHSCKHTDGIRPAKMTHR